MSLGSMGETVAFLEKQGELVTISREVDPDLEMAEIHRRVFKARGPAVFYQKVKGSPFPAVSNLFGTRERALKLLEPAFDRVKSLIRFRSRPGDALKSPMKGVGALTALTHALPVKRKKGPVLTCRTDISKLPRVRCWPGDGGGFILLPQVFSQDPCRPGILGSNLGMYRIQISGGDYLEEREIGLHYQIHRGIANHHARALERGRPLRVSIFVGGAPAHTLAAVMPLPEGMPEIAFAGALAGRRFAYGVRDEAVISLDADFCITGRVVPGRTRKEGPFGDHLGYYSLAHDFPCIEVDAVYHRRGAIWPFTVVGRPPQEDSIFGSLIHEMTETAVPDTIAGVTAVHAVDAAGVHPLLLAKARDRYVPYEEKFPRELLTHALAILGTGQLSLAKYLLICDHDACPELDISREEDFFVHILERMDFTRDLHFITKTTMDTLDYSARGLNRGSKVIWAAAGEKRRSLAREMPGDISIPEPFGRILLAGPGMAAVEGPGFIDYLRADKEMRVLTSAFGREAVMNSLPLVVVVDDAQDAAEDFQSFLWTAFSRSDPAHDIYGGGDFIRFKHWGCEGPLVIDARKKFFHAPPLVPDKDVAARVDSLGLKGGPLFGIIE